MKYVSTRGGMSPRSFSEVLLEGLAPDGGLVIPEYYPKVDSRTLSTWRTLSYSELASEVFKLFIDDIPFEELNKMTREVYHPDIFGTSEITPVISLGADQYLLRLSHGPTLAFKDIAMQILGALFDYVLGLRNARLMVIGATSGDTGSAAEFALRGRERIRVFMLSPFGRMSPFQTAQMFSIQDRNIFNISIQGTFDDCQNLVKEVSGDLHFKKEYEIGTVNSINWARILAQIVYYFKAYFSITQDNSESVSFSVPSGNFGNVFSGYVAAQMGLPIRRLVVATNENNVLAEFFRTGSYRPRVPACTYKTSSPSMDISKASNFERFIYDQLNKDKNRVCALWRELDSVGCFSLTPRERGNQSRSSDGSYPVQVVAGSSQHSNRIATIREIWNTFQVQIDPHTADGFFVAQNWKEPGVPMICLETALPAKFSETLREAIGNDLETPKKFLGIEDAVQRFFLMPKSVSQLKKIVAEHF